MAATGDKVIIFKGADAKWRWHLKAANQRIIATSGESFDSKSNAKRAGLRVTGAKHVEVME
jgi:uncharacterized protein YegP (UPF0339 family)